MPRLMSPNIASADRIVEVLVRAFTVQNHADRRVVERCLDGCDDVELDSLTGLELLMAVERDLGIYVPSDQRLGRRDQPTLRAYADLVERFAQKGSKPPARVHPVRKRGRSL